MTDRKLPPWTPAQERIAHPAIRLMTALNIWVFRATKGRLGGRFARGAPVCLVTTTGRRSGQRRTVALIYLADGPNVVLVASKGGAPDHPGWYKNLVAHPDVEIQVWDRVIPVTARTGTAEDKKRVWPEMTRQWPDYDKYQAGTARDIPVVLLRPR